MMKFRVSFKYSEYVYCTNIAIAENIQDVENHYSNREWYNIEEATDGDIKEAERKGMPIVTIEHIEEKENEKMEERTIKTLDEIAKAIDTMKTRGAWDTGVKAYAQMIIEEIAERADWEGRNPETFAELQDWALNGAKDWTEASYGGGYLVYNYDIAHTLCNPTELKKTQEGAKEPNPREDWCQVQARALYQAYRKIAEAARI